MFAILTKDVDGRRFDRYFKSWSNAKKEMKREIEDFMSRYDYKSFSSIERPNTSKGLHEYEYKIITSDDRHFHWAIVEGHFQD